MEDPKRLKPLIGFIQRIPIFASLPPAELDQLAIHLEPTDAPAGAVLFEEGGSDDHFFILMDGQVEIFKALGEEGERLLAVREKGSLLGEMSFFTRQGLHTASVRAVTSLKLLKMTREVFDALLHRHPHIAYELLQLLSERLDESENITIQDLTEKNRQLITAYEELKAAQVQIVEKEKLDHELSIARQIQASILPAEMPAIPHFDFGAKMVPARAVGGDFFDLIPLGAKRFGIVVGDVSDKGLPAALWMALTFSLLRAEALRGGTPGATLQAVNRLLLDLNVAGMFVTILYGILDYDRCSFEYARAGHPPPILLDENRRPLSVEISLGQAIGLLDEPVFDERRLSLPHKGMMLVFSDGLPDAMEESGDTVADQIACILMPVWDHPAQAVCEAIWEAARKSGAELEQQDDFTLVCVKFGGSS
jgi:serine phosphatase RsbU (regulator of sigma subunit)